MTASTGSADAVSTLASMDELLGISEIAKLGGVERNSAWRWSRRPDFPPPTERLASGPVWRRRDGEKWLRDRRPKSGRPPKR